MDSYQISVIVPSYNVEEYLEDCVNSLINQTLGINNIEIVIVDDCSTDGSLQIARRYEENYPSIKVIQHHINLGSAAARNSGLELASAKYITFVDADDFISDNVCKYAVEKLENTQCDLFLYEYDYYSESGKKYPRNPSARLFSSEYEIDNIQLFPEIIFATSVCNKVFKKDNVQTIRFEASRIEDVLFSTESLFKANKVFISNKCKYFYRKREASGAISKTDTYFSDKRNYQDHLMVNSKMNDLKLKYPQYAEMIDWFNARSLQPFLYNIMGNSLFSHNEKKEFFYKSKQILKSIQLETINKIDNPVARSNILAVQKSVFFKFFSRVMILKVKNKVCRTGRRTLNITEKLFKISSIFFFVMLSQIFRLFPRYRNVWLVTERGDEAQDNGFSFFKFMRENYPEINTYFLIDGVSTVEKGKLKQYDNIIRYKGIMHKILFCVADRLITAHRGTVEAWNYRLYKKYFGWLAPRQKYVFLQHGITKDNVSDVLGKENTSFDLFITGAKPEYEYIKSTFGYNPSEVAYTGFARFDELHNVQSNRTILLMPTWRKELAWHASKEERERSFQISEYYLRYQSVLNNKQLDELLSHHNYKLVFQLHHEMSCFADHFTSSSDNIIINNVKETDVQNLIRTSSVLITDYSSVFFDFAYMGKPILYYQFDYDEFSSKHYRKGYFDYKRDGFGPVISNEDALIEHLRTVLEKPETERQSDYQKRVDEFFVLRDQENCKRIYNSILHLK